MSEGNGITDNTSDPRSVVDILRGAEQILLQEQRLFGDLLLIDESASSDQNEIVEEVKDVKANAVAVLQVKEPVIPMAIGKKNDASSLEEFNKSICACQKCVLGSTRTNFVFGIGNPNATLMLIGEAPGADEDAKGEPFVGRAGQLLNKILEAIELSREEVYICNILKCRPPGNRKPQPEEVEQCIPYLKQQIALIKPKVILCLGLTAAENLLGTRESLGNLRGKVHEFEGIPLMVTYHPAALLRNPNWKRPTWEDVQAVKKLRDELVQGN